jgi:hypothetical protein
MKKVFFKISLLFFVAIILVFQSCKDKDEQKLKSQLEVTVNGKAHAYPIKAAFYNPITRNIELVYGDQQVAFEISFVNLPSALSITTGTYNATDICESVIAVSGVIDGVLVAGISEGSNASINLASVTPDGNNANLKGTSNDFSMESFLGAAIAISNLKFSAHVEDLSSSMDFISFKVGGNDMTFYTKEQSNYTDNGDLRLSANILSDAFGFGTPGILIMLRDVAYPPVVQTVSTYSNGLEFYYNFWDGEKTQCGDFYEYSNGNYAAEMDNTTISITSVQTLSDGFILTGTFSGKTATYNDLYTSLTEGSFKVKIPKK